MLLSIILITWNGRRLLTKCLNSLSFLRGRDDAEVIVVDNGSEDGTIPFLRDKFPEVTAIALDHNYGVAYARNRALERATGDFLWILDNDTELSESVARGMMDFMKRNPQVGLAGCKLVDADGLVQESCKRFPGIGEKVKNILHRHGYRYAYGMERMQSVFEPEYLIGACQLIRREAYEAAGPLDEKIFYGPEDADFCIRVRKAGFHLAYVPEFTVLHHCQRVTRGRILTPIGIKHIEGLAHLYLKYKRLF